VFKNHRRRAVLAATAGVAATLLTLGGGAAAQASTVQAGTVQAGTVQASRVQASTGQATSLVASAPEARLLGFKPDTEPYPSNCSGSDATCTYSSGWQTYNDGGCETDVTATWWVLVDTLNVTVSVESPYLFASCTSWSSVYFGMNSGPPLSVGDYYGFACSTTDLSCSSSQTWTYQTLNAVPKADYPLVNSMWTTTES
jgi:hypothetical protein